MQELITCTPPVVTQKLRARRFSVCSNSIGSRILVLTTTDDAATASAKIKGELPGSGKEAQKQGEEWASKAGQKLDSTVSLNRTL